MLQLPVPAQSEIGFGAVYGPAAINTPPSASDSQVWRFAERPTATMFMPTPEAPMDSNGITPWLMNIVAMPPFTSYSPDELRIQHYKYLEHKSNKKKAKDTCSRGAQPPEHETSTKTDAPKPESTAETLFDGIDFGTRRAADEGTSSCIVASQMPATSAASATPQGPQRDTPTAPPMPAMTETVPAADQHDVTGAPLQRNEPFSIPIGANEGQSRTGASGQASGGGAVDKSEPDSSSAHVNQTNTDERNAQRSGGEEKLANDIPGNPNEVNTADESPQECTLHAAVCDSDSDTAAHSTLGVPTSYSLFGGNALDGLFGKMKVQGGFSGDGDGRKEGGSVFGNQANPFSDGFNTGGLFGASQFGTTQPSLFGVTKASNGPGQEEKQTPFGFSTLRNPFTGFNNGGNSRQESKPFSFGNGNPFEFAPAWGGFPKFGSSSGAESVPNTACNRGFQGTFMGSSQSQNPSFGEVRQSMDLHNFSIQRKKVQHLATCFVCVN